MGQHSGAEDCWCSANLSGGKNRIAFAGQGIDRRLRSCGRNRKERQRERLEEESDSGDREPVWWRYPSLLPYDIVRSLYPSGAGECQHDNRRNSYRRW